MCGSFRRWIRIFRPSAGAPSPERLIQEYDTWRPHHYASEGQNLLFAARERAGTLPEFVSSWGYLLSAGFLLSLSKNELENSRFSRTVNSPRPSFLAAREEARKRGEDEFTMVAAKVLGRRVIMFPIGYFFVDSHGLEGYVPDREHFA